MTNQLNLTNITSLAKDLKNQLENTGVTNFNNFLDWLTTNNIDSFESLGQFIGSDYCNENMTIALKSLILGIKSIRMKYPETFTSSAQLGYYLVNQLCGKEQEEVIVLYLNTKNELIAKKTLFRGTVNCSTSHPRDILKWALLHNASCFVIAHNHPSGTITPSTNDTRFIKHLNKAGEDIGINLLDSFIVTDNDYWSFKENSIL